MNDNVSTAAAVAVAVSIVLAWVVAGLFTFAWVTLLPALGLAWVLGWLA